MEEIISAKQLFDEINLKVVPMLEAEKSALFKERVVLGLKPDEKNIQGGMWSYPPPLTKERAYLSAVDSVGGQLFQEARQEFRRLQKASNLTLSEYTHFQDRVNKGFLFGKIIPRNAIRLKKLKDTFISVHKASEGARERLEVRLAPLRTPEKRLEIGELTTNLFQADQALQIKRAELEMRFQTLQQHIRVTKALANKLLKLGNTTLTISRSPSPLGSVEIPKVTTRIENSPSLKISNTLKRLTH